MEHEKEAHEGLANLLGGLTQDAVTASAGPPGHTPRVPPVLSPELLGALRVVASPPAPVSCRTLSTATRVPQVR